MIWKIEGQWSLSFLFLLLISTSTLVAKDPPGQATASELEDQQALKEIARLPTAKEMADGILAKYGVSPEDRDAFSKLSKLKSRGETLAIFAATLRQKRHQAASGLNAAEYVQRPSFAQEMLVHGAGGFDDALRLRAIAKLSDSETQSMLQKYEGLVHAAKDPQTNSQFASLLNEKKLLGIYLNLGKKGFAFIEPQFTSTNPYEVLGLSADTATAAITNDEVRAIVREQSSRVVQDSQARGALGKAMEAIIKSPGLSFFGGDDFFSQVVRDFQRQMQAQAAADRAARAAERAQLERTIRGMQRWFVRLAVQCAVTTAACQIEKLFPGQNLMEGSPTWAFWATNIGVSFLSASNSADKAEKPLSEGVKGGALRGAVLIGCAKAMEWLL